MKVQDAFKLVLLASSAVLVMAVSVPSAWRGARTDTLVSIRQSGVLRIGYSVEPPYAWPDPDGKVTGEAAELARLIAARLGTKRIEWRMSDFGALLDGLQAGTFDVAAASMFITPARRQRADFSNPSLRVREGLLVRHGNPLGLHSYEMTAAHTSAVVAALAGSVEADRLARLGLSGSRLLIVPDAGAALGAVTRGDADALALTDVAVNQLVAGMSSVEAAEPFIQPGPAAGPPLADCGFAFRKGDDNFRMAWNQAQAEIVGGREHVALLKRFGLDESHLPDLSRRADP